MITPMGSFGNTPGPAPAYDPLRVAAYTGGFGTMPSSQYLTPAGYGSYRQLPGANMSITPNMQPGFFGNAAIAMHMPFTYNPAVNPMVYRAHAARRAADTASMFGINALGFGTDIAFGLGAGALAGGGALGMMAGIAAPMLLPVGGMMANSLADRMRETNALRMRSMAKITSGRDLDLATGMGFSGAASANIDRFIRRQGAGDFLFREGDYRNILNMGMESGLFDYAGNNAEQYKRQLKKLRNTFATAMSVLGSTDFKDILKDLKRLQDLGATAGQMGGILRREEGFARMAGMSHADLVSTYGQSGAVMATTRGLAGITGSLASMGHAGAIRIAQQNGLVNPSRLAAIGGESGYVTMATESSLTAEQNMEKLIAAAVSNNRGNNFDYTKMENLLRKARGGNLDLVREAASSKFGMDAVTMQNLEINSGELHRNFRNVLGEEGYKNFQRQLYQAMGDRILANNPNATQMDRLIAGYRYYTGADAREAAITMRMQYDPNVRRQNERSERLERLRQYEEERERNTIWNRAGVAMSKFVTGLSDSTIGRMQSGFARFTDVLAAKSAGAPGMGAFQEASKEQWEAFKHVIGQGLATKPGELPKAGRGEEYEFTAAQNAMADAFNGKGYRKNSAELSRDLLVNSLREANRVSGGAYSEELIKRLSESTMLSKEQMAYDERVHSNKDYHAGSAGLYREMLNAGAEQREITADEVEALSDGTMLFSRGYSVDAVGKGLARAGDVDNAVYVYTDPKTGRKMVRGSGKNGEITMSASEWLEKHAVAGKNGTYLAMSLRASEKARLGSPEWQEKQKAEAAALEKLLLPQFTELNNAVSTKMADVFYGNRDASYRGTILGEIEKLAGRKDLSTEMMRAFGKEGIFSKEIQDNLRGMDKNQADEIVSAILDAAYNGGREYATTDEGVEVISDNSRERRVLSAIPGIGKVISGFGSNFKHDRKDYEMLLAFLLSEKSPLGKDEKATLLTALQSRKGAYAEMVAHAQDSTPDMASVAFSKLQNTNVASLLGISEDAMTTSDKDFARSTGFSPFGQNDVYAGMYYNEVVAVNQAALEAAKSEGSYSNKYSPANNETIRKRLRNIQAAFLKRMGVSVSDEELEAMSRDPSKFFDKLRRTKGVSNSDLSGRITYFSNNKNAEHIMRLLRTQDNGTESFINDLENGRSQFASASRDKVAEASSRYLSNMSATLSGIGGTSLILGNNADQNAKTTAAWASDLYLAGMDTGSEEFKKLSKADKERVIAMQRGLTGDQKSWVAAHNKMLKRLRSIKSMDEASRIVVDESRHISWVNGKPVYSENIAGAEAGSPATGTYEAQVKESAEKMGKGADKLFESADIFSTSVTTFKKCIEAVTGNTIDALKKAQTAEATKNATGISTSVMNFFGFGG